MSKSVELKNISSEKDALKNIADFFYESISGFKRTLTDLTISINHFLNSLHSIEKQLGMHGFEFPENSSDVLYERLTKGKELRKEKQKDFIVKLIKNPIATPTSSIYAQPERPPQVVHPEPIPVPTHKELKEGVTTTPPPIPAKLIAEVQEPLRAGPITQVPVKPSTGSLGLLKTEMLETIRTLKKRIKDYK